MPLASAPHQRPEPRWADIATSEARTSAKFAPVGPHASNDKSHCQDGDDEHQQTENLFWRHGDLAFHAADKLTHEPCSYVLFGTRGTGIVSTEAEVLTKTDADPVSAKGFAEDTAMLSDEQRAALIAATWPWPASWIWSERPVVPGVATADPSSCSCAMCRATWRPTQATVR